MDDMDIQIVKHPRSAQQNKSAYILIVEYSTL
jgi:hypothetical protein